MLRSTLSRTVGRVGRTCELPRARLLGSQLAHRNFARRSNAPTPASSNTSSALGSSAPPPPSSAAPPAAAPDPWTEVVDPSSGQKYWWNKTTNETTAVGAPKPTGVNEAQQQVAQPSTGSMLRSALVDGIGWGIGSSMAHRLVDGVLGPRQMEVVHTHQDGADNGGSTPPSDSHATGDSQGWNWGEDQSNNDSGSGEEGGGFSSWFGGGDDEW
mmetsp:Transcript_85967/g.135736  ORF Transcript_85967/g.135736 Transcript_85967/m.135736 type:complete len:213 (-) Transcript_85967:351-989(-)|eukprot:CAMPEP_0169114502 /NCGR_PEP_ID=MMETSP1015-20121227/28792_1 /TAXON_ID=342587 /ORGANISM="Karlodinium micrum, Strain CCMP2283" /LENGTH=212 /DNA_ID=CAMNT_0009176789 /DNA_START=60 /DNA_END=698 /DNA_ORIENTATION=-